MEKNGCNRARVRDTRRSRVSHRNPNEMCIENVCVYLSYATRRCIAKVIPAFVLVVMEK